MNKLNSDLISLVCRMPAEWESHEATWVSWPHNEDHWPEGLDELRTIYTQIIGELIHAEKVNVLVQDKETIRNIENKFVSEGFKMEKVSLHEVPTRDIWIRDYGPTFVGQQAGRETQLAAVRWIFNAWGGKYEDLLGDDSVPEQLARILNVPTLNPGIILEGGSIDVNGQGFCLTTQQCLLNPNRNKGLKKEQIESVLAKFLGVKKVQWLDEGLSGDDTDGHVDNIARLVGSHTIIAAVEPNRRNENYAVLDHNLKSLRRASDSDGNKFQIVPLVMPDPITDGEGRSLPATYVNFYIANDVVLIPVFGQKKDREAISVLKSVFPEKRIVGIPCSVLVQGMGALHCMTQQQPQV